jgi:hypothetical protein
MTVRVIGVLAIAAAVALGCMMEDTRPERPPSMTLLSPRPLDAVAYRDGDGPWTVLDHQGDRYFVELQREKFSVALVCRSLGLAEVIHQLAGGDFGFRVPCGDPLDGFGLPATTHRWQGAILGAGPGAQVTVSFGIHQVSLPAAVTGSSYSVDLRPGPHDLLAIAQEADGSARVIVRHHVEVGGPGTLDLDFGSPEAVTPRLNIQRLPAVPPGELVQAGIQVTTWRGARGELVSPTPGRLPDIPAGFLSPDDVQEAWIRSVARDAVQLRQFSVSLATPDPINLTLPDPLTGVSAALAATAPVVRPRVSFQPQPGVLFYQFTVAQLVPTQTVAWVVNASAAWLAADTSLELPDLSAVPGFPPELGPPSGVPLQLELTAVSSNRAMEVLLDGVLPPGPGESTSIAKTVLSL